MTDRRDSNLGGASADRIASHGFDTSLSLWLPPLAALFLAPASPSAS